MDEAKLGTNTASLANFGLQDAIRTARELGFQTIELLAFAGARHSQGDLAGFWFNKLSSEEKHLLHDAVESFVHVSIHLPFIDTPLFSHNEEMAELARQQLRTGIDGGGFLGAETATLHVNQKAFWTFREYWGEMVEILRCLGDHASRHGIKLGIETMLPSSIEDYVGLIAEVDHDCVGATIDVGHISGCSDLQVAPDQRGTEEACRQYNDTLIEIVERLGDKIHHFHLHDVRRTDWRDHRAAGTGIVDFERLFGVLKSRGYGGLLTFELEEAEIVPALAASKEHIEKLMA